MEPLRLEEGMRVRCEVEYVRRNRQGDVRSSPVRFTGVVRHIVRVRFGYAYHVQPDLPMPEGLTMYSCGGCGAPEVRQLLANRILEVLEV